MKTIPRILHLLIVEDNRIALRMIESMVSRAGCCHTSALSAEEGLQHLEANTFDGVLTDIGLPGISGFEFSQQICARWAIPVFGITAHRTHDSEEHAKTSGMKQLLTKPLSPGDMQSLVNRIIEHY